MSSVTHYTKETLSIPSSEPGVKLSVWLYKPKTADVPLPVVIAGHGLTLTKEAGLAAFGANWSSVGWASVIFDYRYFGMSGGTPRDLVDLVKQVEDYRSAINWVSAPERRGIFRKDKIVVMGSALSGLHISELAGRSREEGIAGAMAHCPLLDGYTTLTAGPVNPRLLFWASIDWIASKLGLGPVFVRAIGKQNEFAFITAPSAHLGFTAMCSQGSTPFNSTPNRLAPRLAFQLLGARPGIHLKNADCPVLVVMAEEDDLIPPSITREVIGKALGKVQLVVAPGGHFDIMEGGKGFKQNISAQLQFLQSLM